MSIQFCKKIVDTYSYEFSSPHKEIHEMPTIGIALKVLCDVLDKLEIHYVWFWQARLN